MTTATPSLPLCFGLPRILVFLLVLSAAFWTIAFGQSTGRVRGQVSNLATGSNLEGARIVLEPLNQTTFSVREGSFDFDQVPPGSYRLVVSYTGLDTQTIPVEVRAGETAVKDANLSAEIYQLNTFTVTGEREGSAEAVTLQRNAPNVKNVMSADAFGNIADGNIGNFLQRLPGLSVVDDEGEIHRVMVRGINPNLNSVAIDGTRIASASNRGPFDRAVEIDKMPADMIERIEVTKAMTPDMDADSIGGAINLKTKSSLDYKERVISYSAGTSYNVRRKTFRPIGNIMFSDILGKDRKLGLLMTASYNRTHKPRDSAGLDHEATADTSRPNYFWIRFAGEDQLQHERIGLGLTLDYKLSDTTRLYFNSMYTHYGDILGRHRFTTGGINAARIQPGWTDSATQTRTVAQITFNLLSQSRDRQNDTSGYKLGGESRFQRSKLDYSASFSTSKGLDLRSRVQAQVAGIGFRFDRSRSREYPEITQIGGLDIGNIENYRLSITEETEDLAKDRISGAEMNYRTRIDTTVPAFLKTGFRYRKQERETDGWTDNYNNYTGAGGLTRFIDRSYNYAPLGGLYSARPYIDKALVLEELRQNRQNFVRNTLVSERDSLNTDATADESVLAGYLMGEVTLGRLFVLGGVRVEQTRINADGVVQVITPEEQARRAAWVGPVTDAELARRTVAEFSNRRQTSGDYQDIFPSVHFKYDLGRSVQARASFSTGIGRPSFADILPNTTVNHDTLVVTSNNVDLKPQFSDNFDLSLEYYFEPAGMLSAGVFLKELREFIYSDTAGRIGSTAGIDFDGQYQGYELRSNFNGGSARVRGLELAYQQQFSLLPGFWKGFGAFANYTYVESEGNYGQAGVVRTGGELENFTPRTYNAGISYIARGVTVRVKFTQRSPTLNQYNAVATSLRYVTKVRTVDLNLKYDWKPGLSIFLDVINLFDYPTSDHYSYLPSRPFRSEQFTVALKAGVSGRF